ncbi:hypothetical protein HPB48_002047 [Haemaphysalis longicornis]|uniref:Uncharacterized protein n=1 Tax=Haemaphysalis longicornis TaxID=44386 RepID=A0A9J6FGG9_HAELO|nr:hypothetical protein HPB48_002047 [Haemaphysalis longicornis]
MGATVDLFIAVQMLAAAWMSTKRDIIKNCFVHTGFRHGELTLAGPSDAAANEECSGQGGAPETAAARGTLREAGIVPDSIDLYDFVDADADVIVYEELSDEEILRSACAAAISDAADSSDDDEVACGLLVPVTASRVMDSLDTLCTFLGAHDDDVAMQIFTKCEQRILLLLA